MIILKSYWLGSQKAGMLRNIGLESFQAFQPPSFKLAKLIAPNWYYLNWGIIAPAIIN